MIGNYYLLYELIQNVPKTEDLYGNLQKRWSNWCTRAPPRLYLVPGLTLLGAPPTSFHGTRQATQALERVAAAVFVNSTKLWVPHSVLPKW